MRPFVPLLKYTLAVIFILLSSIMAMASSIDSKVRVDQNPSRLTLNVQSAGAFLVNQDESLTGLDFGSIASYALGHRWAVSGEFHQAFSSDNFSTLYSSLSIGVSFSQSGLLMNTSDRIDVGLDAVASRQSFTKKGFIFGFGVSQYFFNGNSNVVPLVGPEVSVKYQMSSQLKWLQQFGLNFGFLRNGEESAFVGRVLWNVGYWL